MGSWHIPVKNICLKILECLVLPCCIGTLPVCLKNCQKCNYLQLKINNLLTFLRTNRVRLFTSALAARALLVLLVLSGAVVALRKRNAQTCRPTHEAL